MIYGFYFSKTTTWLFSFISYFLRDLGKVTAHMDIKEWNVESMENIHFMTQDLFFRQFSRGIE